MIDGHFFQSRTERGAVAGDFGSVGVRFEFVFARPGVGKNAQHSADWFHQNHEKHDADVRADGFHTEGLMEEAGKIPVPIGGEADEEKDDGCLENADGEALADVAFAEVADFVSEYGEEF